MNLRNNPPAVDASVLAVSARDLICRSAISPYQMAVFVLCFVILVMDGFDTVMVAYAAPLIKSTFHADAGEITGLLSAGLIGLAIGSFLFGPIADKFGRKVVVISTLTIFAAFTIMSARTSSMEMLILLRLLTGLGLGGATPNAIALVSELTPDRHRSLLVTIMACAIPVGGAVAGVVAAQLLPSSGWRALFYTGGLVPAVVLPLLFWWLPESPQFLMDAKADEVGAKKVLQRVLPSQKLDGLTLLPNSQKSDFAPLRSLFLPSFRGMTWVLWAAAFLMFTVTYFLNSWLPSVIHAFGGSVHDASLLTAIYLFGSPIGAICIGYAMDKYNPFLLITGTGLLTVASVFSFGHFTSFSLLSSAIVFAIGFGVTSSQAGLYVIATRFYAPNMRATGLSCVLGFGRIGSIVGSVAGGFLLSLNVGFTSLFHMVAIPFAVATILIFMAKSRGRRGAPLAVLP